MGARANRSDAGFVGVAICIRPDWRFPRGLSGQLLICVALARSAKRMPQLSLDLLMQRGRTTSVIV
jgi:hypothetical protein